MSEYPQTPYWKPPLGPLECGCECGKRFTIKRDAVHYWPDHLWAGAINARFKCPKCKRWNGRWSHELPEKWMGDLPRMDWLEYCLPRLIDSCHTQGIPAGFLVEFENIPYFGEGPNPIPGKPASVAYRTERPEWLVARVKKKPIPQRKWWQIF